MMVHVGRRNLGITYTEVLEQHPEAHAVHTTRLGEIGPEYWSLVGLRADTNLKRKEVETAATLVDQYAPPGTPARTLVRLESKLMFFQAVLIRGFGSLEAVRGKKILDVGCGSRVPDDQHYSDAPLSCHPWMCRLVHHLGGHAIGIDVRPQQAELFESHTQDLLKIPDLSYLADVSIDGYYRAGFGRLPSWPEKSDFRQGWIDWNLVMNAEAMRLLKPEGVLLSDYHIEHGYCSAAG